MRKNLVARLGVGLPEAAAGESGGFAGSIGFGCGVEGAKVGDVAMALVGWERRGRLRRELAGSGMAAIEWPGE
ncbi:MAG: hypothetical protein B7Z67_11235 [Acidiphilium sp. 21-60-14]|nr:MAG: hypothetical protein B7Z67_11235 [Acidiphilium sp. 21-60-14]